MPNIKMVADGADVILNGYAFTFSDSDIRVLNLEKPGKAAVYNRKCELLSTSMDDIELHIVGRYLSRSIGYMED